jgi:hypothetical protein
MGAQVKSAYATLVGEVISARYRVVGEVGRTDFGVLYLAEDNETPGRSVAINVLITDLPALEIDRRRFEADTEALARRADIDLTDFINAGRLADGRPYWVLACQAIVPHVITPEQTHTALRPQAAPAVEVGRRLDRYEIVPVYRRQPFLLGFYGLPVLLAVLAVVIAKMAPSEPPTPPRFLDRHLSYTVFAQPNQGVPGAPQPVELPRIFTAGDRISLELATPEEGYLYVIHETAPSLGGTPNYRIAFPTSTRAGEQAAYLSSTQTLTVPKEGEIVVTASENPDRLWIVWSASSLDAFSGLPADGRLDTAQITAIQELLGRRALSKVKATFDPASKRTKVASPADPWIQMISLGRE